MRDAIVPCAHLADCAPQIDVVDTGPGDALVSQRAGAQCLSA